MSISDFKQGFYSTILWAELDRAGKPLDANFTIEDIAPESKELLDNLCIEFLDKADKLGLEIGLETDYRTYGHDFWLTIAGHGCGYWDGDYPIDGDKLTELCEQWYCTMSFYIGDDGLIYC